MSHARASRAGEIGRDAQQRQFVSRGRQIPVVCNFWRVKREVPREAREQADERDSRGVEGGRRVVGVGCDASQGQEARSGQG